MTPFEAAEAARRIEPGVAVPMHWGTVIGIARGRRGVRAGTRPSRRASSNRWDEEESWRGNGNGMQQSLAADGGATSPSSRRRLLLSALPAAAAPRARQARLPARAGRPGCVRRLDRGRPRRAWRRPTQAAERRTRLHAADRPRDVRAAGGGREPAAADARPASCASAASAAARCKLRKLAGDLTMRDIARAGVDPDPDLLYRALPYAIDPGVDRGHIASRSPT